jgi:DNA-binding response OmpR family regulator
MDEAADDDRSILLVEDDPVLAETLERYLSAHRLQVTVVGSTEDAARMLGSGLLPGLVILDINLPGRTGWDLLRDPAYLESGSPPVVVTTATRVAPTRLREFSVAGYLPKPFPIRALMSAIDRILPVVTGGA